jgi:hypothetical protein
MTAQSRVLLMADSLVDELAKAAVCQGLTLVHF